MLDRVTYEDLRRRRVDARPEDLWRVVEGIGGERGWHSLPLAWAVRGRLDRLVGGTGLRRGRRDPDRLVAGDPLDFWRVQEVVEGTRLRLRAEMRLPGTAELELHVDRDDRGRTVLVQRALFSPRGLAGHAYWWAVTPFHGVVHASMLAGIAGAAQDLTRRSRTGARADPGSAATGLG